MHSLKAEEAHSNCFIVSHHRGLQGTAAQGERCPRSQGWGRDIQMAPGLLPIPRPKCVAITPASSPVSQTSISVSCLSLGSVFVLYKLGGFTEDAGSWCSKDPPLGYVLASLLPVPFLVMVVEGWLNLHPEVSMAEGCHREQPSHAG